MVRLVRRDTGEKIDVALKEAAARVAELLEQIQGDMLERARIERDASIKTAHCWEDFMTALSQGCMVLAPFCCEASWEKEVGVRSAAAGGGGGEDNVGMTGSAKALCIPLQQPEMPAGQKCFISGEAASKWVLFGRSY